MTADVTWCPRCKSKGQQNHIRKVQINFEEAVFLCCNEKCVSYIGSSSASSLILRRRSSEIPSLQRKKRKLSVERRPFLPDEVFSSDLLYSNTNFPTLQWKNEDALCWLDVSMFVIVHCSSLRNCLDQISGTLSLKWLCREFDRAQRLLRSINGSWFNSPSTLVAEVVDNSVDVQKGGGDGNSGHLNFRHSSDPVEHLLDMISDANTRKLKNSFRNIISDSSESLPKLGAPKGTLSCEDMEVCRVNMGTNFTLCEEDFEISEPKKILDEAREYIWRQLEPILKCKKGTEETPVFALPVLLRCNKAVEEHFMTRYYWEFYCTKCCTPEILVNKKVMPSVKKIPPTFTMNSPTMLRPCLHCNAQDQISRLVLQSLPLCPMLHFVNGLPPAKSWRDFNFVHQNHTYLIYAIIQYKQMPNHFIAWVRDNKRNMWLKADDLKSALCQWEDSEPVFPSSEAHIVMWERQGKTCTKCYTLKEDMVHFIDAPVQDVVSAGTKEAHQSETGQGSGKDGNTGCTPLLQVPPVQIHAGYVPKNIPADATNVESVDREESSDEESNVILQRGSKNVHIPKGDKEKGSKGHSSAAGDILDGNSTKWVSYLLRARKSMQGSKEERPSEEKYRARVMRRIPPQLTPQGQVGKERASLKRRLASKHNSLPLSDAKSDRMRNHGLARIGRGVHRKVWGRKKTTKELKDLEKGAINRMSLSYLGQIFAAKYSSVAKQLPSLREKNLLLSRSSQSSPSTYLKQPRYETRSQPDNSRYETCSQPDISRSSFSADSPLSNASCQLSRTVVEDSETSGIVVEDSESSLHQLLEDMGDDFCYSPCSASSSSMEGFLEDLLNKDDMTFDDLLEDPDMKRLLDGIT